MAHHMTWEPASGVRQVNVRYKTNNPAVADIERLRELTPYKNLNKIMLEALLIGSRVLLKEFEAGASGVVNISSVGRSVALGGPSVNATPNLPKDLEGGESTPIRKNSEIQGDHLEPMGLEGLRHLIAKEFEPAPSDEASASVHSSREEPQVEPAQTPAATSVKFSATAKKHLNSW